MEEQNETEFSISEDDLATSRRIDAVLSSFLPAYISRSRVKSLLKAGTVSLNGNIVDTPNHKLKSGDRIKLVIPEPEDATPKAENIPVDVLFEDDHLIVVNKPASMVVHPAAQNWEGTLVNALLHHCGDSLAGIGGVRRPGIVHRLDKETSGVMVVAKTDEAHAGLSAQFADHGKSGPLERAYLALVWGALPSNKGTVDAPLGRSNAARTKRAVVNINAPDARHAITHFTVVRHLDGKGDGITNASLVECRLETGRTHQIRVHMAHIGHPLIGDQEYGKHFQTKSAALEEPARSTVDNFRRQALHAAVLGFEHPVTGEHLSFEAPVPADFEALLASFDANSK